MAIGIDYPRDLSTPASSIQQPRYMSSPIRTPYQAPAPALPPGNGYGGAPSQDPSFGGAANRGGGMGQSKYGPGVQTPPHALIDPRALRPGSMATPMAGVPKGMQGGMAPGGASGAYAAGMHNAAQMNGGVANGKASDAQGGMPVGPPQMSAQDVQAEMARRQVGAQVGANPQNAALSGYLMG